MFPQIAGALAEGGCSLEEVTSAAQQVADNIGKRLLSLTPRRLLCVYDFVPPTATMSVSLSPCSVPGHKPNFTLGEDEMELGLGRQVVALL